MTKQAALMAALLALGVLSAGCSGVEGVEEIRLELDDQPVNLPRPTLVTCKADAGDTVHFAWTGSNLLVPRHPWDEDHGGSQIRVDFAADPPVPAKASLQIYVHDDALDLQWSDGPRGKPPATLTKSGAHGYTFIGTMTERASGSATWHSVRIEFPC